MNNILKNDRNSLNETATLNESKGNKLAGAVLVCSMVMTGVSGVQASEKLEDASNNTTYWGLGIGTVLGALVGGPPGAALGGTLGGSLGWGIDLDEQLTMSTEELNVAEIARHQSELALRRSQSELHSANKRVQEMNKVNAIQAANLADLKASEALTSEEQAEQVLKEMVQSFTQEIYFRNAEAKVPDYVKPRLERLSSFLKAHPELTITLKGYTDHRGSPAFNEALAKSRVNSVRDVMLEHGVEAHRVSTEAIGEVAANSKPGDAGNYILDRRVSIEFDHPQTEGFPVVSMGELSDLNQ